MLRKSLAIDEKVGLPEGMAINYANLGTVQKQRGDWAGAREFWGKSRELHAKVGLEHEAKEVQGWPDELGDKCAWLGVGGKEGIRKHCCGWRSAKDVGKLSVVSEDGVLKHTLRW